MTCSVLETEMSDNPAKKPNLPKDILNSVPSVLVVQPKLDDPSVTEQVYADVTFAWQFLNERNFDGKLLDSVFVFTRHKKVQAYFRPNRFQNLNGKQAHEIGLNSGYLRTIGDAAALALIARLQCHQWRYDFGPVNARSQTPAPGYTDRITAVKMIEVGLMPPHTGLPEGDQTGYDVSHFVIEGGQFDLDCKELLASGFRINWHDKPDPPALNNDAKDADANATPVKPKKKATRTKFACDECEQAAWAKASAQLLCGRCGLPLISQF